LPKILADHITSFEETLIESGDDKSMKSNEVHS